MKKLSIFVILAAALTAGVVTGYKMSASTGADKKIEQRQVPVAGNTTGTNTGSNAASTAEPSSKADENSKDSSVKNGSNSQNGSAGQNEADSKIEGVKADNADAEEVVSNFTRLLPQIVSYKDMDFTLLDSILDKSSSFYKDMKAYVDNQRKSGTSMQLEDFTIEQVTKTKADTYNVYVTEKVKVNNKENTSGWCYVINAANEKVVISTRTAWKK